MSSGKVSSGTVLVVTLVTLAVIAAVVALKYRVLEPRHPAGVGTTRGV